MDETKVPVIVGGGQVTHRGDDPAQAPEPLEMMARAARLAADDAGVPTLVEKLDSVQVVNILSWSYADAPGALAERLGAHPKETIYSGIGGNTPQYLVNQTADRIAAGKVGIALIAGVEMLHSSRKARRLGVDLPWTPRTPPKRVDGEIRPGTTEAETAHGARMPIEIYPLFENALRAAKGLSLAEHRRRLGELCAAFTRVAAANPNAWFRQARTPDEITTVTPANRMVGFPYPKYMNAIMEVDQSAAVLLTSAARARELGVPEDRWVYLWGGAEANDHWFVSDRVNYHTSPAIRAVGQAALRQAGASIEQIEYIDIYSCFPAAVQIGRDMLGIAEDDPRPLTLTGGLPYHGGPGNNYTTHAIVEMVKRLRDQPNAFGLVTALGWYVTKHAIGVYSGRHPGTEWSRDISGLQPVIDAEPHPPTEAEPDGPATVETFTVIHGRDGAPERGIIIGRLKNGRRFIANAEPDQATLEAMEREETVGRAGRVSRDPATGLNIFRF